MYHLTWSKSLRDKAIAPFCSSHARSRPSLLRRSAVPCTCPLKATVFFFRHGTRRVLRYPIMTALHARRSAYHPRQRAREKHRPQPRSRICTSPAHQSTPMDPQPATRQIETATPAHSSGPGNHVFFDCTQSAIPPRTNAMPIQVSASRRFSIRHPTPAPGLGVDGGRTARYDLAFGPPLPQHRE